MGLCEHCKKAQATFHLTNITRDGEKMERHLCEHCAISEGLMPGQKPSLSSEILDNFIAAAKSSKPADTDLVCDECGISYVEFRNKGLLGCPKDYDVFHDMLAPLIKHAHAGAAQHVGKAPRSGDSERADRQELRRLHRLLDEAVAGEDYERAAELRDRIRDLEAK